MTGHNICDNNQRETNFRESFAQNTIGTSQTILTLEQNEIIDLLVKQVV